MIISIVLVDNCVVQKYVHASSVDEIKSNATSRKRTLLVAPLYIVRQSFMQMINLHISHCVTFSQQILQIL